MLYLLWSATGLLYSRFPFPAYHTELKSTMAVTAIWAEEMWVSLSLPGICYTQDTPCLPFLWPPCKISQPGPAGELGNEIPQSWGLSSSTNDVSCSQPAEAASPPAPPQVDFPLSWPPPHFWNFLSFYRSLWSSVIIYAASQE